MQDTTRVMGYFAAGLLTAAALYGIYALVSAVFHNKAASGDDDPIIVAGGSLDISSRVGFAKDDKGKAHHLDKGRKLTGVVVIYNGGNDVANVGAGKKPAVAFAYCYAKCPPSGADDTITFKADPSNLSVANSLKTIGDEADGKQQFTHQPTTGTLSKITVNNTDYPCGPKGTICMAVMVYNKP